MQEQGLTQLTFYISAAKQGRDVTIAGLVQQFCGWAETSGFEDTDYHTG
jgi:hypothetical protein